MSCVNKGTKGSFVISWFDNPTQLIDNVRLDLSYVLNEWMFLRKISNLFISGFCLLSTGSGIAYSDFHILQISIGNSCLPPYFDIMELFYPPIGVSWYWHIQTLESLIISLCVSALMYDINLAQHSIFLWFSKNKK